MSAETWRVVLDDGSVREVPRVEACADSLGPGFIAGNEIGTTWGRCARSAVAGFASAMHWPVAAILAPGEVTREEAADDKVVAVLADVARTVRYEASNHGALRPGDNRNDDNPSGRTAERLRDSILWHVDRRKWSTTDDVCTREETPDER